MIYSLRGKLIATTLTEAIVECGGVGYRCFVTGPTLNRLPQIGQEVILYTHMNIREGAIDIFGFLNNSEQSCFKLLTSVSGVGPKVGIAILSQMDPDKIYLSIVTSDFKSLTQAAGVGPKLAQRIILELKDKIKNEDLKAGIEGITEGSQQFLGGGNLSEAMNALESLGYTQGEAAKAISGMSAEMPIEDLIKGALKKISGQR